ncbi:hypothetical protein [Streptomyces sp. NPDC047928]|uniref:hypothetical protein n=1 Tax=unclassified Streptomyces TaxID=2593676 RepID=UPI00371E574A
MRGLRTPRHASVGFVREGVEREALLHEGERIDALAMSVLAHEWARHRGRPALPSTGRPAVN